MEIRYWRQLNRHPLSAEYEDLTGRSWQRFVEVVRDKGILAKRKIIVHDGKVLDGWQLYRACLELDTKPDFADVPKGWTPEEYVEAVNDNRRHMTQEAAIRRAEERRERVAAAVLNGQTYREIAAAEGVSLTTVHRDLNPDVDTSDVAEDTEEPEDIIKTVPGGTKNTSEVANNDDNGMSQDNGKPAKAGKGKPETKEESNGAVLDSLDCEVPTGLLPVFSRAKDFQEIVNQLNAINRKLKELSETPAGNGMRLQQSQIDLRNLKETVRFDMPYAVCPVCKGIAKTRKANCPCKNKGWLVETSYKNLPQEYRQ